MVRLFSNNFFVLLVARYHVKKVLVITMNSTEEDTIIQNQEHEYRMKQLDVELKKQENKKMELEHKKFELEHQYRMKQLEYENRKLTYS